VAGKQYLVRSKSKNFLVEIEPEMKPIKFGRMELESESAPDEDKTVYSRKNLANFSQEMSDALSTMTTISKKVMTAMSTESPISTSKTSGSATVATPSYKVANVTSQSECSCGMSDKTFINRDLTLDEHELEIAGGRDAIPHEFPWIVRITGGCAGGVCGGSLVSPRVVLSAYHCAVSVHGTSTIACDHSDGQRVALLGRHDAGVLDHITIPIIKAYYPENAWLRDGDITSHDLVLYLLKEAAKYTNKVSPICLPEPNAEFGGMKAIAAGWGRTNKPEISEEQSRVLKAVTLTVSTKIYNNIYVLGTELSKKDGMFQDPCSGDSGGPLMYHNVSTSSYVLIGTVNGGGYDCRTDSEGSFEGSNNGVWNKVSAHMEWILKKMKELGENACMPNQKIAINSK